MRTAAGVFDVSHMGRLVLRGAGAGAWLDRLLTGRASALPDGKVLYTMLLDERGGVLDDLLVSRRGAEFVVVVNAANHASDRAHLERHLGSFAPVELEDFTSGAALIALQGPRSRELLAGVLGADLGGLDYYWMAEFPWEGRPLPVSRTGYTGELGYELFVDSDRAGQLWDRLLAAGAMPCGLGCRDTLRLELGYPLYGHELDRDHTPLEAGLAWTVDFGKGEFLGRAALLAQQERGVERLLRGIEAPPRVIPRQGYSLWQGDRQVGTLASGSVSPTLGVGIGTVYLPRALAAEGTGLELEIRGRRAPVRVVKPPFYRQGTARA